MEAFSLDLPSNTSAPRLARTLVAGRVGDHERLPDLLLCVSEVVTNAVLHARSPGEMHVRPIDDGIVVEVTDHDPRLPTRRQHDLHAPTGRGLHLLDALTRSWGTRPVDDGKVVWFEFELGPAQPAEGGLRTVELWGLPLPIHRRAMEHGEALRRELTFVHHTESPDAVLVRLRELGDELGQRFGGLNDVTDERLARALDGPEATVDLTYRLPVEAADAFERLVPLLEELDRYCTDRDLLTLVTPPEGLAYRRWWIGEVVEQLRQGRAPRPWVAPAIARDPGERAAEVGGDEAAPRPPKPAQPAQPAQPATTIAVVGDLDLERAPSLREEIVARTDAGATVLEVDLGGCTFLDSTGLSLLVTTHLRLEAEGGSLRLTNLTPPVASILELSGLSDVMT